MYIHQSQAFLQTPTCICICIAFDFELVCCYVSEVIKSINYRAAKRGKQNALTFSQWKKRIVVLGHLGSFEPTLWDDFQWSVAAIVSQETHEVVFQSQNGASNES
jgi:hypothetical protein